MSPLNTKEVFTEQREIQAEASLHTLLSFPITFEPYILPQLPRQIAVTSEITLASLVDYCTTHGTRRGLQGLTRGMKPKWLPSVEVVTEVDQSNFLVQAVLIGIVPAGKRPTFKIVREEENQQYSVVVRNQRNILLATPLNRTYPIASSESIRLRKATSSFIARCRKNEHSLRVRLNERLRY